MQDRREHQRVRQRRRIGIILSSGEVIYAWTYDISLGGVQILCEYGADIGDEFDVFLSLLDPESDTYRRIDTRVRISHLVYAGELGCYRIGMQFVHINGEGQDVIERYIEQRLSLLYHRSR